MVLMGTSDAAAQFESWRSYIPDFLREFFALVPEDSRRLLDFSPQSLDVVEAWILDRYADTEPMLLPAEARVVNLVACYIGETFRQSIGGEWGIRWDDPKFAFHGIPIVVGIRYVGCPLTLTTACADRRTGSYLRRVLENALK
jgi:hypothetical protein